MQRHPAICGGIWQFPQFRIPASAFAGATTLRSNDDHQFGGSSARTAHLLV